jgi:hypothetical protein
MKFWKLSHDKTMYDFERILFYSLKTVFTEILKTRIKFMEILFVSICFNYTYFICQKTMMLFTKNRLVHWKGVKIELIIIGVIIRP